MTIENMITELNKFPRDYELILDEDPMAPEGKLTSILFVHDKLVIIKFKGIRKEERGR